MDHKTKKEFLIFGHKILKMPTKETRSESYEYFYEDTNVKITVYNANPHALHHTYPLPKMYKNKIIDTTTRLPSLIVSKYLRRITRR
jgi:hypothetical protein